MSAKNIILLVSAMHSGGAERTAANLANAWSARGHSVSLVVTYSGRGDCFYALDDRVNLVFLSDLVKGDSSGIMQKVRRLHGLRQFINTHPADVVLSFLTNVNVAALIATLGLKVPVIVAERIYPPHMYLGAIWNWLRKLTYPLADRVVMLTSEGKEWLQSTIPSAQGAVIPNPVLYPLPAVEPALQPNAFVSAEQRLLLAVGRLDRQKGFDKLLTAFAHLAINHPSWVLVVLGEGPERTNLEQLIHAAGLEHRLLLPGKAGNIGAWYAAADLYVMSSRFEGFPNTLVEAMAYGCAAISYDCDTGPRDIIRDSVDGLLVRPVDDIDAMVSALARMMLDDEERARMGSNAVAVRERYSIERVLSMWDELFNSVMGA